MLKKNVELRHPLPPNHIKELTYLIGKTLHLIGWTSIGTVCDHRTSYSVTSSEAQEMYIFFYIHRKTHLSHVIEWKVSFANDLSGIFGYTISYLKSSTYNSFKREQFKNKYENTKFNCSYSLSDVITEIEFYGVKQKGIREGSVLIDEEYEKGHQDIQITYSADIIFAIFIHLKSGNLLVLEKGTRNEGGHSATLIYAAHKADYLKEVAERSNIFGEKMYYIRHTIE